MDRTAPPAWRSGTIRAAGAKVATFETGSDAADARTVLLLHGLGYWTDAAWGRLVGHLDPGLRYVGIDLPGFGTSEKPDVAYDLRFFRDVLDEVVDARQLRRFALLGHSLGGFLAADYAGRHPERIDHLALIAPAAFARTPRFVLYGLASGFARRLFTRRPSRRFVVRTLERSVVDPRTLDPGVVARAYDLSQEPGVRNAFAGIYASALDAFTHLPTLHADFARYTGPVLCAWGRRDRYIPVAALRAVTRVYPNAQTLILENSAHQPMIEQPHLLAPPLREFFAG